MFFRRAFNKKVIYPELSNGQQRSADNSSDSVENGSSRGKVRRNFISDEKVTSNRAFNVIQLTPLWEHVIRTRHLPADINISELFDEFTERLNDPEWQVRQHALRVLVDVLIVLGPKSDAYFAPLVPPLVDNLGHAAPAVRKGALDALRVYIGESSMPENVLYDVIDLGINGASNSLYSGRLTVGVMLSLPSLVQVTLTSPKRRLLVRAAINALLSKIGEMSYQEISLKILIRLRDLIGDKEFYDFVPNNSRHDFDVLCSVYGLNKLNNRSNIRDSGIDINTPQSSDSLKYLNKLPQTSFKKFPDKIHRQDDGIQRQDDEIRRKYNEIRCQDDDDDDGNDDNDDRDVTGNSGIYSHETHQDNEFRWQINHQASFEEIDSKSTSASNGKESPNADYTCTNDSSGGCPFNSNNQKLINCPMTHVTEENLPPGKVIMETEIKISEDTAVTMRILEADPSQEVLSENSEEDTLEQEDTFPTDSIRTSQTSYELENEFEARRTPKRVHFGGEVVKIRTPDSDAIAQSDLDDHIKPITMNSITSPKRLQRENVTNIFVNQVDDKGERTTSSLSIEIPQDNTRPILERPKTASAAFSKQFIGSTHSSPEKSTPRSVQSKSASPHRRRSSLGNTLDVISPQGPHKPIEIMYNLQRSPLVSPVKSSPSDAHFNQPQKSENPQDEPKTPVKNPPSINPNQSDNSQPAKSWEELDIVSREVVKNLRNGDWRTRSRAFGKLEDALLVTDNFAKVQPCLDSLLRTLLSSEKNQDVAEDKKRILVNVISRLPLENLEGRTNQILIGLCRQGGPNSNNIAKAMMQRMPAAAVVLRLLSDEFLHSRSSRFRENALQIVLYALMTFPSTYFDVNNCVTRAVNAALDRKRRVRQAALDVISVLGQISSPKIVIDVTNGIAASRSDGDKLIAAVKARLSRKQLPMIRPDDSVQYGLKLPTSPHFSIFGADVEWITNGIGSVSPKSSKYRLQNTLYINTDSDQDKPSDSASSVPSPIQSKSNSPHQQQLPNSDSSSTTSGGKIDGGESWSLIKKANSLDEGDMRRDMVVSAVPLHLRPVKEEAQLQQQSKQSFPELSLAKNSSILKSSPKEGGAASSRTAVSRFPIMENGSKPVAGQSSDGVSRNNPYNNPSSQRFWSDFGHSQGQHQRHYGDLNRPVTYPLIFGKSAQTVRFSTPDKLPSTTTSSSKSADSRNKPSDNVSQHANKSITNFSQFSVQSNGSNDVAFGVLEEEKFQRNASPTFTPQIVPQDHHQGMDESVDVHSELSTTSSSSNFNYYEEKSNLSNHSTPTRHLNSTSSISQQINDFADHNDNKRKTILSRTMSAHTLVSTEKINEPRPKTSISLNDKIPFDEIPIKTRYSSNASLALNQTNNDDPNNSYGRKASVVFDSALNLGKSQSITHLSTQSLTAVEHRQNSLSLEHKLEQIGKSDGDEVSMPTLQRASSDLVKSPRNFLRRNRKVSPMKVQNNMTIVPNPVRMKAKEMPQLRPSTLSHFERPKEAFTNCITQLESTNWETTMLGLKNFQRLIRHHPDYLDPHIHILAGIMAKHVRNLRSQVARSACQATNEFFVTHRKQLETEADDLVLTLLHRTADTNKFLRKDASRALESMCDNLSIPKVIHLLSTRGACHQNALVRTTASMQLTRFVANLGGEKVFYLNKECRDKIIITAAQLLTEGSLETRNHAKQLFKLLSVHPKYNKVLMEVIPTTLYRHIEKTLKKV